MRQLFLTKIFILCSIFFILLAFFINNRTIKPIQIKAETKIINTGFKISDIPAINNPRFTSVFLADNFLFDNQKGIHLNIDGRDLFYSDQILNWHHVVNQAYNDKFIAITRCPLCDSSAVYLSDNPLNSGLEVINNNAILWDNFGHKWRQIDGKSLGDQPDLQPLISYRARWGFWKLNYRNGEVLTINTGFNRDYTRHPFINYQADERIFYPSSSDKFEKNKEIHINFRGIDLVYNRDEIIRERIIHHHQDDIHFILIFESSANRIRGFYIEKEEEMSLSFTNNNIIDTNSGSIFNIYNNQPFQSIKLDLQPLLIKEFYSLCRI